jgi:raffinose/stachyose/melibiose transport system substrate-binding protein
MDIEGTWRIGDLLTNFGPKAGNNNEWSWVPMPSKTGEAIFDVGIGNTLAINQKSASPNAVAQILDFYFSSMSQGNFLATYKKAPAPVRIKKEDLKGVDPRHVEILGDLDKAFAANNYGYTTWVFWGSKSENYLYEEIEKVWAGKETAEQYLEGLQKIMADERTKGELPPIPKR